MVKNFNVLKKGNENMKTITIMSLLLVAISVNTFAADQCKRGSDAQSASTAKVEKDKGDAVDQFQNKTEKETK